MSGFLDEVLVPVLERTLEPVSGFLNFMAREKERLGAKKFFAKEIARVLIFIGAFVAISPVGFGANAWSLLWSLDTKPWWIAAFIGVVAKVIYRRDALEDRSVLKYTLFLCLQLFLPLPIWSKIGLFVFSQLFRGFMDVAEENAEEDILNVIRVIAYTGHFVPCIIACLYVLLKVPVGSAYFAGMITFATAILTAAFAIRILERVFGKYEASFFSRLRHGLFSKKMLVNFLTNGLVIGAATGLYMWFFGAAPTVALFFVAMPTVYWQALFDTAMLTLSQALNLKGDVGLAYPILFLLWTLPVVGQWTAMALFGSLLVDQFILRPGTASLFKANMDYKVPAPVDEQQGANLEPGRPYIDKKEPFCKDLSDSEDGDDEASDPEILQSDQRRQGW